MIRRIKRLSAIKPYLSAIKPLFHLLLSSLHQDFEENRTDARKRIFHSLAEEDVY